MDFKRYVRPPLKSTYWREYANRPSSHVHRHASRNQEAVVRQRVAKERHRAERVREAETSGGHWQCPRCQESNYLGRAVCRKCSFPRGDLEDLEHEGELTGGGAAVLSGFRRKNKKRGGAKHKKRPASAGEIAAAGRSRTSGSGTCRSPFAHPPARAFAGAAVAAIGTELWLLLHTARTQTERVVEQTARLVSAALVEVELTTSEAGDVLRSLLTKAGELGHVALPVVVCTASLWGLAAAWKI